MAVYETDNEIAPQMTVQRRRLWREVALLFIAVLSVAGGTPLIRYLEGHGWLDWAARVNLKLLAELLTGGLWVFAIALMVALHRARCQQPRRPSYVKLLSGYRGPPGRRPITPQKSHGVLGRTDAWGRRRRQRLASLRRDRFETSALLSVLLGFPVVMLVAVGFVHWLRPDLDLRSGLTAPILICPVSCFGS